MYADDAKVTFVQDWIVVKVKTQARVGTSVGVAGVEISLSPTAEVSMVPFGERESIGFPSPTGERAAEVELSADTVSERAGALKHQVGCSRFAAQGAGGLWATSGFKVVLERLKVHSIEIQGDVLVVDPDRDIV